MHSNCKTTLGRQDGSQNTRFRASHHYKDQQRPAICVVCFTVTIILPVCQTLEGPKISAEVLRRTQLCLYFPASFTAHLQKRPIHERRCWKTGCVFFFSSFIFFSQNCIYREERFTFHTKKSFYKAANCHKKT